MRAKFTSLIILLLIAVIFCGAAAKEETVLVGIVAPLTGDQAYIGVGMMQGAQIAIEEANIKGPVSGIQN